MGLTARGSCYGHGASQGVGIKEGIEGAPDRPLGRCSGCKASIAGHCGPGSRRKEGRRKPVVMVTMTTVLMTDDIY